MNNKMAVNTYLSTTDSKKNKIIKPAEQNYRCRECFNGCQMGGGWGMGEKSKGIKKYKLLVTE